jgi:uncharacterized protein involved in exopolysaccharide biosynthesis
MRLSEALTNLMIAPKPSEPPPRAAATSLKDLMTLANAQRILRKYWRHSLGIFAGIMLLVFVALALAPRTYQSEAKLFVRVGRESVTLDPTATTGQMISVYESRENEINSVVDVLQSRVLLESVVDSLKADLGSESEASAEELRDERLARDRMIRSIGQSIEVVHSKKSNVITLNAKAESPELAQKILKEMLAAFREQHLRINRTQGSFEFFQEQRDQIEEKLNSARASLRDAKNDYGLATVEGQRKILEEQILALETALMENDRERLATKAELAAIDEMKSLIPREIQSQKVTGFFPDAKEQTREQLHQLELEYQKLSAKYTDRQSQVRAVKAKIQAAKAILASEGPANAQQTQATNPAYQQIELQRVELVAKFESLAAKHNALGEQKISLMNALNELNANEIHLAALEQDIKLHEDSFKTYSEKLEQARIDQELEDERISNVNIVQPASLLLQPVSPKKSVVLFLGFIVAATTSLGYGFVRELLKFHGSKLGDHPQAL